MSVRGAFCAQEQDRFWEVHDAFFEQLSPGGFNEDSVVQVATALGLNQDGFIDCLFSTRTEELIRAAAQFAQAQAEAGNFSATPTVLIDGKNPFPGPYVPPWGEVQRAIQEAAGG